MKEITRVHLATIPYHMEIVAKKELENYLAAIQHSLGADDDAMREIEARIVELFTERGIKKTKAVTLDDVEAVKSQLGAPLEFADGDMAIGPTTEESSQTAERRVMRDPSSAMLGGVCAGLAAYWRTDVVWVRLGMLLLTVMSYGVAIPVYIVAWIVMPPARTAAERLQMAGKPVTLAALKEASALPDATANRRVLLQLLRVVTVAALVGVALAATVALGLATLQTYQGVLASGQWQVIASAVMMGLAGVTFVLFCLSLAYMLATERYTRRILAALGSMILVGLGLFGVGTSGLIAYGNEMYHSSQRQFDQSARAISSQHPDWVGIKKLVVQTDDLDVQYHAESGAPHARLEYHTLNYPSGVAYTATRSGDVVTVSAALAAPTCSMRVAIGCNSRPVLHLYGPALEEIDSAGNLRYQSSQQEALSLTASRGRMEFAPGTAIATVTMNVSGMAMVDGASATIANIKGTIKTLGSANFGIVHAADIEVNAACPASSEAPTYAFARATSLKVNGVAYAISTNLPCVTLEIGA